MAIARLGEVQSQAARMRSRSGYQVLLGQTTATLSFDGASGAFSDQYTGLTDEQRDALVVVLRQFTLDSDRVSFRSLSKLFEQQMFTLERRDRFRRSRQAFNAALDTETPIISDGEALTYRRVVDVYFYGKIIHRNAEKARLADAWADGPAQALYLVFLDDALRCLIRGVEWLDSFCGFALEEL